MNLDDSFKTARRILLLNGVAFPMVPHSEGNLTFLEVSPQKIGEYLRTHQHKVLSAIGHEGTARLMSEELGFPVRMNRIEITLGEDDVAIVFQLERRAPEGIVYTYEQLKKLPRKYYVVMVKRG